MTRPEYLRRLDLIATVATWSDDNAFKPLVVVRLEGIGPAAYGDPHAPAPTDRESPATEARIAHRRETAEALGTEACEF